jgi:uncharacterized lipoprotein YajG
MITRTLCAPTLPRRRTVLAGLGVICAALGLAACGGGQGTEFETQAIAAPLELPVDPALPAPRDRYLPRQQAELLSAAEQDDVLWIDVSCCKANATENAGATRQALTDSALPDSTAIFVTGSDARLAAAVAHRLDNAGLPRVFLVSR